MRLPRFVALRFPRGRLSVLLTVAALSGALLLIQSIAAHSVITRSFEQLEKAEGQRSLDRAIQAVEVDLRHLAVSTHDYAIWDAAYAYLVSHDSQFVESNLPAEARANMNVDLVWMIDESGKEVLSIEEDPTHPLAEPHPASAAIVREIRANLAHLLAAADSQRIHGLVPVQSGLLALAASRVLPTNGRGIPRGTLVFGRFLDASEIDHAARTSQMTLRLYDSAASVGSLPMQARELWSSARSTAPARVLIDTTDESMTGYQLLRDLNGKPVGVLAVDIPRALSAFGRHTGWYLVGIFGAVIGIFGTAVGWLLLDVEKLNAQRNASERRYRAVITQAKETMLLVDTGSRRILEANPAATVTLGYSLGELASMGVDELFYAVDGDVLRPPSEETLAGRSGDRFFTVRCKGRDFIDVELTSNPLTIDERAVTSVVLRDVSARRHAERQLIHNQDRLAHLAHHDMLTGLLNRVGLERRLPEVITNASLNGRGAAFLYIDLDNFKKINDLHGHACGDKLLQLAAERLREGLSFDDLVVRMGGDEFVVVAGDLRDEAGAAAVAARIRNQLAMPFEVDGRHFKVTASIGLSIFPAHGENYEVLLKNADIALYESKESGRDAFTVFSLEMIQRVTERLAIEAELREALTFGQLYLDYQPLVDVKTQAVTSFEALVRWNHPVRGRVPPLQFIGIAERSGQIVELGAFVIREACRQVGEWQRAGLRPVPVAVNVSSKQLEQPGTVDVLQQAFLHEGIAPGMLRVEITESVFMEGSDRLVKHLNEIRDLGVTVSVDDFGTGYSSLAYLKNLPVDCLKIDRAFVRDLNSAGGADEVIVRAIIQMAQSLGLSTVAEGVETLDQVRRLGELGADYMQGYYFSPPVAAGACQRFLSASEPALLDSIRAAG